VSQLVAGDPRFRVLISNIHQSEKVIQIDWTAILFGSTPYSSEGSALDDSCSGQQQQQLGVETGQDSADQSVDRLLCNSAAVLHRSPAFLPEIRQVHMADVCFESICGFM
jgi:hypothetical protein